MNFSIQFDCNLGVGHYSLPLIVELESSSELRHCNLRFKVCSFHFLFLNCEEFSVLLVVLSAVDVLSTFVHYGLVLIQFLSLQKIIK